MDEKEAKVHFQGRVSTLHLIIETYSRNLTKCSENLAHIKSILASVSVKIRKN